MIESLKNNKITITIISIASIAIISLFYWIFWGYPNFIRSVFYNYACPTNEQDFSYNIGTFGDMYGGLNAFLSGLAFVGAVAAIFVQIILHRREIENDKLKLENEKKDELEKKAKQNRDKLFYLKALLELVFLINEAFIDNVDAWLETIHNEKTIRTPFIILSDNVLNTVINKLNQEEYYITYTENKEDREILLMFSHVEDSYNLRFNMKDIVQRYFDKMDNTELTIKQLDTKLITIINSAENAKFKSVFQTILLNRDDNNIDSIVEAHQKMNKDYHHYSFLLENKSDYAFVLNEVLQLYKNIIVDKEMVQKLITEQNQKLQYVNNRIRKTYLVMYE